MTFPELLAIARELQHRHGTRCAALFLQIKAVPFEIALAALTGSVRHV